MKIMHLFTLFPAAALALSVVAGCNRTETAEKTQTSVAATPSAERAKTTASDGAPSQSVSQTSATPQVASGAVAVTSQEAVISVEGMSCMSCVATITRALNTTAGVTAAKVDLEKSEARIEFDPAKTDSKRLATIIDELGYKTKAASAPAK